MGEILFKNFALLDPRDDDLKSGYEVLVRDGRIASVEKGAIRAPKAETVEGGGRTLMPGLIDCHLHILARGNYTAYRTMLPSLVNAHAGDVLRGILMRGFTTARDAAGADLGHKQAVEQGLVIGPRLFVCGRAISQTGGHGDGRNRADLVDFCPCVHLINGTCRVADGVTEVRKAIRDEIRLGAESIKINAGGGVASASDPIDQLQYSMDELKAAVDETTRSHIYCLAHVYTDAGIKRCLEAGIRTIEHGNFLEPDTAAQMAASGTYLVPTLVTYRALKKHGADMRLSADEMGKIDYVLSAGTRSLEVAKAAGVKMAYGSDVFRSGEHYETEEFLVRAEVLPAIDVIRSATLIGAEVVGLEGQVGIVEAGAFADFIVVDGNPLDDLGLFHDEGAHLSAIMKDGAFYKNRLQATESDHPSVREMEMA